MMTKNELKEQLDRIGEVLESFRRLNAAGDLSAEAADGLVSDCARLWVISKSVGHRHVADSMLEAVVELAQTVDY